MIMSELISSILSWICGLPQSFYPPWAPQLCNFVTICFSLTLDEQSGAYICRVVIGVVSCISSEWPFLYKAHNIKDLGGFDFYDAKLCIMANSTWAVCPWSLKPLLSIHPAYNPFLYICQNWSVLTIIPNADYHHSILIIRNLHLLLLLPLLFPMVSPNNNMITLNQCIVNIRPNTDQRYFNS